MSDTERRQLLGQMGLVTTSDLMASLRISRKTLAKIRSAGLRQYAPGKDRFYRLSEVADALAIKNGE